MHQAHFYTLLPAKWKKNYECINAPYKDCKAAEEWFKKNEIKEGETTWELYQRYDPEGSRAMHQGSFYSLLPAKWKESYEKIDATYKDCKANEDSKHS